MSILVTGAGFVGCQIARQLVDRGESVVLLDIEPSLERVATILDPARVRIVRGDILDLDGLERLVAEHGITRIAHTAAVLGRRAGENPPRTALVNLVGSANVLELARRVHLKRVVLSGSNTVVRPAVEVFQGAAIPEDLALRVMSQASISFYAATKLAMEHFVHLYARNYGVDGVVVRYGRVLGAFSGENAGEISSLVHGYLGPAAQGKPVIVEDPTWIWEGREGFVDARDCAAGTVGALFAEHLTQRVYTTHSEYLVTYEEFIATLRRIYPDLRVEVRAKPGRGGQSAPYDLSAARRDLGYRPRYDLEASLRYLAGIVRY